VVATEASFWPIVRRRRRRRDKRAPTRRSIALIVFVCLHGSAKSLIAAEHFRRRADARGILHRAASFGLEPDPEVPPHVVAGLATDGFDVRGYVPRLAAADELAAATRVVSFGCDVGPLTPSAIHIDRWDDVPMVSDGYARARDAIVARVEALLDDLS
jgi:protein-tyrosine-phosphatase